ncbi:hypothetical protein HSE3_gp031 [Bacillus phage vB_BceM-HSE3]|nr:hypothetical protein HSE3_gp031 [Bacillus phage vB_BceM-HSE3]
MQSVNQVKGSGRLKFVSQIDQLLDEYNDYKFLYEQFKDESHQLKLNDILQRIKLYQLHSIFMEDVLKDVNNSNKI